MRIKRMMAILLALALLPVMSLTAFAYTGDTGETEPVETKAVQDAADAQDTAVTADAKDNTKTAESADDAETTQIGIVTTNGGNLNVRNGASTDYKVIGQLANGDTVTVIGEENGWYKVIVPEKEGYVYGGYLSVSDVVIVEEEPDIAPLTPDGNLDLVDDIIQNSDGKEFLTVQSKNDNTFYIVIDRDKNGDNVYFLNLVDEADLMALMEDGEVTVKCTCKERCEAGHVDTTCPVCKNNLSECTGAVSEEPVETEEPETEPEEPVQKSGSSSAMLLGIVLIAALGIGGAVYFVKFRKKKPDTKGPADLDDYDFGEDDDEDDTEYVTEDEIEDEQDEE